MTNLDFQDLVAFLESRAEREYFRSNPLASRELRPPPATSRARDRQRSRVLKAEQQACVHSPSDVPGAGPDAQAFVDAVVQSNTWRILSWEEARERPAKVRSADILVARRPASEDERETDRRLYTWKKDRWVGTITVPRKRTVSRWSIVHALAHHATGLSQPWHGPAFCRNHLRLVHEFLGAVHGTKLREELLAFGAEWLPVDIRDMAGRTIQVQLKRGLRGMIGELLSWADVGIVLGDVYDGTSTSLAWDEIIYVTEAVPMRDGGYLLEEAKLWLPDR